jgi:hypothetical protein
MTTRAVSSPPVTVADRIRAVLRDHPLGVAIVAAISTTALAVAFFNVRYETNDDPTMQLIVSGIMFDDQPDEHLLFTNVLIGLPLRSLYVHFPDVPWYASYQLLTLTLSTAAALYAFLRVNSTLRQGVVCLLYLLTAVLPSTIELQFTKTAFLACLSGILLLITPLYLASPASRVRDIVGCALLISGSLIRFECLLMAFIMMVPAAVAATYFAPRRAAWRLIPIFATLVISVALYQFNQMYYARDPAWKEFYAYNAKRAEFTDYQRYRYTPESATAFRDAGWSEIDYGMMLNWFFADRDLYSLERMQQISQIVPPSKRPPLLEAAVKIVINLRRFADTQRLLLAMLCAAVFTGGDWRRWILPVVLFGESYGLTVLLGCYYWIPIRVVFTLVLAALAGTALRPAKVRSSPANSEINESSGFAKPLISSTNSQAAASSAKANRSKTAQRPVDKTASAVDAGAQRRSAATSITQKAGLLANAAALLVTGGLVVWTLYALITTGAYEQEQHQGMKRVVHHIDPKPNQLFVLWREWFPVEKLIYPLEDTRPVRNFKCLPVGFLLPTPIVERRMNAFKITNIYHAIFERQDVFLVAIPQLVGLYMRFIQERYGFNVVPMLLLSNKQQQRFYAKGVELPQFEIFRLQKGSANQERRPEQ